MLNNINVAELRMTLYSVLKEIYLGKLYLEIDSIKFMFESDDENLIDRPSNVIIEGSYGRISPENPSLNLNENYVLTLDYPLPPLEKISGYFLRILENE